MTNMFWRHSFGTFATHINVPQIKDSKTLFGLGSGQLDWFWP